jgi:phosphoribosyl 1,2-cyclic phosphodiesterase
MNFIPHRSSSASNLYTVESDGRKILIEAGARIKTIKKAVGFKLSSYDGCLISHAHKDHARGLNDLLSAGVYCYATHATFKTLNLSGHRAQTIKPLEQFKIANYWKVLPFPTEHDCPGSVGFLISDGEEKLCFITDTFYCRYAFRGVTTYAIECNYSKETLAEGLDPVRKKRLLTSHFSLENVLNFFEANDMSTVREIFLMHLSDENSDEAMFKTAIQAKTGKPVKICQK